MSEPDGRRRRRGATPSDLLDASVLEPLIEFAIRQAATGGFASPITPIEDQGVSEPYDPGRWGPLAIRIYDSPQPIAVLSPAAHPAFDADVAAFLASRHEDRRRISKVTFDPMPKRGEAVESTLEGWGWLYEVDGYGYHLVCGARVRPGVYLAWDMPDYHRRDALYLATAFIGGHLGRGEPGETLWHARPQPDTSAR